MPEPMRTDDRHLEHDRLGDLVTDLEAQHGHLTEEELAAARAEWPSP